MRPKRNPEVAWRIEKGMREMAWEKARRGEEYEEMGIATLMAGGSIHQLNLVGAEIWSRINGVHTAEKIAGEIAALFEADPGEILGDVEEFLKDMERRGWVTLSGGPSGPAGKGEA